MNTSMMPTHFMLLTDIVLLEIFTYLSCEDILYAFADLHNFHLVDLLTEHGAFQQICLSSQLSLRQYNVLSNGIWRYDLVRSFVCKEMFSDFIIDFTPSQIFSSLTELRVLFLRGSSECLSDFIIAHSSTLTHFTVRRSDQSYNLEGYETFLQTILPHLDRLKLLDTDWRSYASVEWSRLVGCLQALEHLFTFVESMSDVYALAVDGFFPHLQSLRIYVNNADIKTVSTELPATTSLCMPKLETFDLHLKRSEEQVEWATVETLISYSVMPRLRRCSLIYSLPTSAEIRHIFQSSLFHNNERRIHVRFAFHLNASTAIDSFDTTYLCDLSTRYNKVFMQYNDEDKSDLQYTWFTSSWTNWMTFSMDHHNLVPYSGVRHLEIETPNILLHSIGKLVSNANELTFQHPASLTVVGSSLAPTPLINLRHLAVIDVIPGLELLLDGVMLPRLHSLNSFIVPLFVTLARRTNQMKTLDTIDHLVITDQSNYEERCFSIKQWHIVLDALPRLRTLLVQFHNPKCPPIAMADLFVDYIRRTTRTPLILFSCCIDDCNDMDKKEHFITYLEERIEIVSSPVQIASLGPTRLDAWM